MNSVLESWESILETIRHHLPAELTSNVLVAAGVTGVVGLILSLWGAKVFRAAIVIGFLGLGAWGGLAADQWLNLGMWFCVISCALLSGAIGLVLYRLWVGVGWAFILSSVALSVLATNSAVPHWQPFQDSRTAQTVLVAGNFQPPSVEQQARFNSPELRQVFADFGGYLTENVPNIKRNSVLIGGLAGTLGLLMGLLAVRFTMILASSITGVILLTSTTMYGLSRYRPDLLEQWTSKPAAVLAAMGIGVLLAMFAQWIQDRKSAGARGSTAAKQVVV